MPTETNVSGQPGSLYGIMAEFDDPESLLNAANQARSEGYREMDAYTPMPVEGLAEAIGHRSNRVQRLVFAGGLCGATPCVLIYKSTGGDDKSVFAQENQEDRHR